jgi:aminoglycoside 2'-N-acetyltransferase I
MVLTTMRSPKLATDDIRALRTLLDDAFRGDFTDEDWAHACGGWHVLVHDNGALVAHASVAPRWLEIGSERRAAGYVEAVAVATARQRAGFGSMAMRRINAVIADQFELGALSTGRQTFYERLGWQRWRGPSWVRHPDGRLVRTPDEDEGIMVLRTVATPPLDATAAITCDARAGESW